jgi:hypothetical protein
VVLGEPVPSDGDRATDEFGVIRFVRPFRLRATCGLAFEVIEEAGDQRRVEIGEVQPRRRDTGAGCGVAGQQW